MRLPSLPSLGEQEGGIGGQGVEGTGPPVNLIAPFVSGVAETGETLSCNGGTWSGEPPIVLTYQWERDGTPISGETDSTLLLVEDDEGADITCVVTATNGEDDTAAESNTVVPSAGGEEVTPLASDTVLASDTELVSGGIAA